MYLKNHQISVIFKKKNNNIQMSQTYVRIFEVQHHK